jgi:hypothetical protein
VKTAVKAAAKAVAKAAATKAAGAHRASVEAERGELGL